MIYFTVTIHSYFMGDWWCMIRSDSVSLFGAVDSFEALKFFIMDNSFTKADRFDWIDSFKQPVDWFFTTDSFLHPNGFVLFDLVYSLQKVLFSWLILVNMINSHTVILS